MCHVYWACTIHYVCVCVLYVCKWTHFSANLYNIFVHTLIQLIQLRKVDFLSLCTCTYKYNCNNQNHMMKFISWCHSIDTTATTTVLLSPGFFLLCSMFVVYVFLSLSLCVCVFFWPIARYKMHVVLLVMTNLWAFSTVLLFCISQNWILFVYTKCYFDVS